MKIQMIGHSTVLIETHGQRLLTDPFFGTEGNRIFERLAPPAVPREALRDTDIILVSHTHWDHVDRQFFLSLAPTVPVVAPRYAVGPTRRLGAKNVIGLKAWDSRTIGEFNVTAVPAIHDAIGAGFVIRSANWQLYFAGDTFYHPFMKQIGRRWKLDVALLPVTTTRIPLAMNPSAAVKATQDLLPKVAIPIHLGLRPRFGFLRSKDTPEDFERQVRQAKLDTQIVHLKDGAVWFLE